MTPPHAFNRPISKRLFITGGLASNLLPAAVRANPATSLPPVPAWRPSFSQPIDRLEERFVYYTDGARDFVILKNGTCVLVDDGLSAAQATDAAFDILSQIYHFHPDMNPAHMDDGNIMVRYDHPAFNVVLADIAHVHWAEIEARHQDALVLDEVLLTPQGQNVFDDFGKQALLGRCYMFMDAEMPAVSHISRHATKA